MTEAVNQVMPAVLDEPKQHKTIPFKRTCPVHHTEYLVEGKPPDHVFICKACDNDKVLCDLFLVKDKDNVSRKQLQNAIIVLYDKVNELTLELFCENPNHPEFNGVPAAIHHAMILKKIERMTAFNRETKRK